MDSGYSSAGAGPVTTIKRGGEFAAALARRTTTAMVPKYYQNCKRQENRRKREKKRAERERKREDARNNHARSHARV